MKHIECLSRQAVAPAPGEDKYADDSTMFIGAVQHDDSKRRELEETSIILTLKTMIDVQI